MGVDEPGVLNASQRAKVGEVWEFSRQGIVLFVLGIHIDDDYKRDGMDGIVFDCINLVTGARDVCPWSIDYDERWQRLV